MIRSVHFPSAFPHPPGVLVYRVDATTGVFPPQRPCMSRGNHSIMRYVLQAQQIDL